MVKANGRVWIGPGLESFAVYVDWNNDGTATISSLTIAAQRAGYCLGETLDRARLTDACAVVNAEVFSGDVNAARKWARGRGWSVKRGRFYSEALCVS